MLTSILIWLLIGAFANYLIYLTAEEDEMEIDVEIFMIMLFVTISGLVGLILVVAFIIKENNDKVLFTIKKKTNGTKEN